MQSQHDTSTDDDHLDGIDAYGMLRNLTNLETFTVAINLMQRFSSTVVSMAWNVGPIPSTKMSNAGRLAILKTVLA